MLSALVADSLPAQTWSPPFNHNQPHAGNGVFTSPYSPWNGLNSSSAPPAAYTGSGPVSSVPDNVTYLNTQLQPPAVVPAFHAGWPQPGFNGRCFEAVHMALIPKGPFRGQVLVWNIEPVLAAVHPPNLPAGVPPIPAQPAGQSYQAYAIIDPADTPLTGIRYHNYLVPISTPLSAVTAPVVSKNLFCAGHAWSPYGDLVVAGGTDFVLGPQGQILFAGGTFNYVFNPRRACSWPGTTFAYYLPTAGTTNPVTNFGMWVQAPDLQVPRWYATVTVTHGLARPTLAALPPGTTSVDKERAVILGGSETVPALPHDRANPTYEALVVLGEALPGAGTSNLVVDQATGPLLSFVPTAAQSGKVWDGPVISGPNQGMLYEYPRTFLLSTGELFVCGYTPRASWVDHDAFPGVWTLAGSQPGLPLGSYSSNWQFVRHDGSAVLFPNLGGNADTVLRVGGANDFAGPTTDTVESIAAGGSSNTWVSQALMPPQQPSLPTGGRAFTNLVTLPTGDLLLLGGQWQDGTGASEKLGAPLLFSGGVWTQLAANPVPSPRTYHSTAVLLPDGRVFLGGGDDRYWDYEIFSPPYLNSPLVRPVNITWLQPAPVAEAVTGALELHYDGTYRLACERLPVGHAIAKAVLTAPGSVTHHSDMHQRYVELQASVTGGNEVTLKVPGAQTEAPRGIYMLWLVTNQGVPSVAEWVVLR